MTIYKCTGRYRNGNVINGYELVDSNNNKKTISTSDLKEALIAGKCVVSNLVIDENGEIAVVPGRVFKGYEYNALYGKETLYPYLGLYRNGNICLGFSYCNKYDELADFCRATVNITDLPYLYAAIDTNNNGAKMVDFLVKNKFGTLTGNHIPSGYCVYPVIKFNEQRLKEIDPIIFEKYKAEFR